MRCFVAASDDEIYAYIARFGAEALVPYQVGMRVLDPDAPRPPWPQPEPWLPEEPRRAA
ncbi:MAG: hypothetical protein IT479_15100 [Xanthomonadales bacterium]|nr:hypothetical protein [Xanthomonadales bacterium]MCC6594587.1 hypothetical protein [Xanthomonadales bacterium]